MENAPWVAAIAAAVVVFALVAWRVRAPPPTARAASRDPRLARVNGPFEAADAAVLEARLAEAFRLVLAADGSGGFAVVEHGSRYVQLGWGGGTTEVILEAVSNEFLPADARLDAAAQRALAALGLGPPRDGLANHALALPPGDARADRLAHLAARTLTEVHGAALPGRFVLTTELDG
jgi:hypothetical protein